MLKKIKINHPDGTVEELEGEHTEVDDYLKKREKATQVKESKGKKQILTDEIRRVVAEELDKRPHVCHPTWWWGIVPPYPVQPNQIVNPQITWLNTDGTKLDKLGPIYNSPDMTVTHAVPGPIDGPISIPTIFSTNVIPS